MSMSSPQPPRSAPTGAAPSNARSAAPELGILAPRHIERAFIGLLYAAIATLMLASVLGTFYGIQSRSASFHPLWQPLLDLLAAPLTFGLALVIQAMLSVAQWGARQMTHYNRWWWLGYLAVLAPSVYYNVVAFYAPATAAGAPPLLVIILLLGGDVIPEFLLIRHRR